MTLRFTEFLRGANGGLELNRLIGALGGFAYIVGAHAFIAWNMAEGREFDITAYCIAFPGGLAALTVGTAGAVAIKDRNVAVAKVTESQTGNPAEEAAEETAEAAVSKAKEFKK